MKQTALQDVESGGRKCPAHHGSLASEHSMELGRRAGFCRAKCMTFLSCSRWADRSWGKILYVLNPKGTTGLCSEARIASEHGQRAGVVHSLSVNSEKLKF